jgi:transposase
MSQRRYELSDFEWMIIEPLLPDRPRGVARVDDRKVLNGIYWRLRTGSPWADMPERYGPYTTCYNRFVRWEGSASGIGFSRRSQRPTRGANNRSIVPRSGFTSTGRTQKGRRTRRRGRRSG